MRYTERSDSSNLVYPPPGLSLDEVTAAWLIAKVSNLRNLQTGTSAITPSSDHTVTPPINRDSTCWEFEAEEDHNSSDSNTSGERCGDNVVVLFPKSGISTSEILPREPNDGDVGEKVAKVIGTSPKSWPCTQHDRMELTEHL